MELETSYHEKILDPKRFGVCVRAAVRNLKNVKFDAFAVQGTSGTLIGGAVAYEMGKAIFLIRKDGDNTHSTNLVEGPIEPMNYVFLDDFISYGKTRKRVLTCMRKKFPQSTYIGTYQFNREIYDTAEPSHWEDLI